MSIKESLQGKDSVHMCESERVRENVRESERERVREGCDFPIHISPAIPLFFGRVNSKVTSHIEWEKD